MGDEALKIELTSARNAVFRLLKIRLRSEREIVEKLKKKEFSDEAIAKTLEYFKECELINDRQFAQRWIYARLNKPFGLNRIRTELKAKGISDGILQEELIKIPHGDEQEMEVVRKLAERRAAIYKNVSGDKLKQRLYGYLARRGFSSESIYKTLKKL